MASEAEPEDFDGEFNGPLIAETIDELLLEQIVHPGWEGSVGGQKSYYIRGVTWLRKSVLRVVSEIKDRTNEDFASILLEYPDIEAANFAWDEPYSPRQGMAALSLKTRSPIQFSKAVQTILLCRKVAGEKFDAGQSQLGPDEVMGRLRIDPAIFYIRDFNEAQLASLVTLNPKVLELLREITGQRTRVVFGDMARGHTVTRKLADMTRDALFELFPEEDFGSIDYRYQPGFTKAASTAEALTD